jgi:hypothetical protein
VGFEVGDGATSLQTAAESASGLVGTIAGVLPPPWSAIAGAAAAGLAGLGYGAQRGRHRGWEEKAEADATAAIKAKAGIPTGGPA